MPAGLFFRARASSEPPCELRTLNLSLEQRLSVSAQNPGLVRVRDRQRLDGLEHERNASDHVGIVAAGENAVRARELDRELQRALREVHRVVPEVPLQVRGGRFIDLCAAFLERAEAAVQPFGEIGNRAAEVAEHPADPRVTLHHAAEYELRSREGCVEQKPVERHQPVLAHRFDADRIRRVNHHHRGALVGGFVQRPEPLVVEARAIDVGEQHRSGEPKLVVRAHELLHRRGRVAQGQRGQRLEAAPALVAYPCKRVVRDLRELGRHRRRFHVGARRRERDHLRRHAVLIEHVLAVRDVAMPADHDVVIAGVVDDGIALRVVRDLQAASGRPEGIEVLGRVVMVVEVDDLHCGRTLSRAEGKGQRAEGGRRLEVEGKIGRVRAFVRFAWLTLAVTVVVIVWGAVVRATGSGAGCGSHWPTCNGQVVPLAPTTATIIEFTHRLTSGLALVLTVVLWVWSRRLFPAGHAARAWTLAALGFMVGEAAIGAGIVLLELVENNASVMRAVYQGVHLTNTMMLVGAMAGAIYSGRRAEGRGQREVGGTRSEVRTPFRTVSLVLMILVAAAGAVVALGY